MTDESRTPQADNPPPVTLSRFLVRLPQVPNFLRHTSSGEATLDVAEVAEEDLREIGRRWTEALVANARARRAGRDET